MKLKKKSVAAVLTLSMSMGSVLSMVPVFAESAQQNLALNKTAYVSAEYGTLPRKNLTDGDDDTRWSTESAPTQWAYVDLGQEFEMNKFQMIWENEGNYASNYNIYVSNDPNNWGEPVLSRTDNKNVISEELLGSKVSGRYVKLEVTAVKGYPNVSCREFKIFNTDEKVQDPSENIALKKTAVASSEEAASVKAANAVDGNTSSRSSRWGSDVGNGPDWIYVDLGERMNVNTVKVFWETRKATAYKIQIADTESTPQESDWQTVKEFKDRPKSLTEKIVLDQIYKARYVRLYVDSHTSEDPDGGIAWNTISIYELEVYGGNPDEKMSMSDVLNEIQVETPKTGDKKLKVTLPEVEGYTVEYNGTDFEQIIDEDLTIYQPISDKDVKVSFKITDNDTNDYKFKEIAVTVPGSQKNDETANKAPNVLPELAEWNGGHGNYTVSKGARIVYKDSSLQKTAEALANDYEDITGKSIAVVKGESKTGDITLALTKDKSLGLQDEGYLMDIDDSINIKAETTTGAYWATRTILQSIKQSGNVPCGTTRDYPLYKVRSFILDVGRKTFTMDYLKQIVKQMSWYKMNDFQVHLNDNLIPIESLADPMTGYSAFRLESDVKKGGNNGLNQQDLTSTDLFYTKKEFKDFIKDSRDYGVDIVPEIDTPAHSLALTKVRPDLRHGTNGRENDHLALRDKYDESLEFVQSIFDEYMTTSDPIFDEQTTVHVGADEYNADKEAYRRFSDDMLKYVQNSGRTARIWGSLTQCSGKTPVRSKDVQMNLWNFGYANMDQMYEQGYDLINCNDAQYYIVPNAGYYYDYLNSNILYNQAINSISGVTIPAGDEQMLGGAIAVWNDMTDYLENGISEYDVYDRLQNAIPLFGAKLWGKGDKTLDQANSLRTTLGDAPGTNFGYEAAKDENGMIAHYDLDNLNQLKGHENIELASLDSHDALHLLGDTSYATTSLDTVGLNNDLRVKVKRESSSEEEQILFESSYGSIKAVQKGTGKVGLSRENHDYSFNYELPVNQWVELEFKNRKEVIDLYVNGQFVDTLGDDEQANGRPLKATMMIPMERIGSKEHAFKGYVDDIRLGSEKSFASTMELDYLVTSASHIAEESQNKQLQEKLKEAKVALKEYDPNEQTISTLTDEIKELVNGIDYKKANYTRVDHYLNSIPKDLSIYTEDSVKNLQFVIDMIQRELPKSMQDTVDQYEVELTKALTKLQLKSQVNVNYIDKSKLTATASSYQHDGSDPKNVLDDNPSTMWHTDWNLSTPHWIAFENKEEMSVNGLTYVPRQTGKNGNVTKYRIEISDDGVNWKTVKEGNLSSDSSTKVIEFDTVKTKHLRLYYVEAVNNNGSAAEIKLHRADVPADVDGLKDVINKAKAMEDIGYLSTSWNHLQDTIKAAEGLVNAENPNANEIEIMKRQLTDAMVKLVLSVDNEKLKSFVDDLSNLEQKDYTKDSWKQFQTVLKEAQDVLSNLDATKDEINDMYQKLLDAYNGLVILNDKSGLTDLISKADQLQEKDYTKDSWKQLVEALTQAKEVSAKEDATKEEINEAISNLEKTMNALKKVDSSTKDDNTSKGNASSKDNQVITSTTKNDKKQSSTAKTGDETNIILFVLMAFMSWLGIKKVKKEEL